MSISVSDEESVKEMIRELRRLWESLHVNASIQQINMVARAYLTLILGVDEQTAEIFLTESLLHQSGNPQIYYAVGKLQSAITCKDTQPFWKKIFKIFPTLHTAKQRKFLLSEYGDICAVLQFLFLLDPPTDEKTIAFRRINANAHLFK